MPLAASMATLGIPLYALPAPAPGEKIHQLSTYVPDKSLLSLVQS